MEDSRFPTARNRVFVRHDDDQMMDDVDGVQVVITVVVDSCHSFPSSVPWNLLRGLIWLVHQGFLGGKKTKLCTQNLMTKYFREPLRFQT